MCVCKKSWSLGKGWGKKGGFGGSGVVEGGGGYNFSSNVILQNRFRIIQKEGEGGWVGG